MSDWIAWAFVVASGFVVAGFLGALHKCATGLRPAFRISLVSPTHFLWGFLICMFAGPHIVAAGALRQWKQGQMPPTAMLLAGMLTLVWSLCAGIVVMHFGVLAGIIDD